MTENDYDNNKIQEVDDNEIEEKQIQEPVIYVEKSKRQRKTEVQHNRQHLRNV